MWVDLEHIEATKDPTAETATTSQLYHEFPLSG